MKKILLLLIVIATSNLGTYSQVLSNTTWAVYDTTNTFFIYFHFNNDTLSFSVNNIAYSNVSTYHESGNNFSIHDLSGSGTSCPDTGHYTFLIQSDTLKFTLVNDLCTASQRPSRLVDYHWVGVPTGIASPHFSSELKIFPNPASDVFSINVSDNMQGSKYSISDPLGRQVLKGAIRNNTTQVDISKLQN